MPADLPDYSAYTYCVEATADEAVKAHAKTVEFSEPVLLYVENFVGFPVWVGVPTGMYDRTKGEWKTSEDGRVIKLMSESGGLAEIDIDGDDAADSAAELAALGFSDAERKRVADAIAVAVQCRPDFTAFAPSQRAHSWFLLIPICSQKETITPLSAR